MWSSLFTAFAAFVACTQAVTVFTPTSADTAPGASYARGFKATFGLLVTFELYDKTEPVYMPVYISTNEGRSWTEKSRVYDTVDKWGMRFHPTILQLSSAVGPYEAGTVVFSGTSVPADKSKTKLNIYVSTDEATSWTYVSTIAEGGQALEQQGKTAVWHPHFVEDGGKLLCYFSDQRSSLHSSQIVLTTSSDLKTWSNPTGQVVYDDPKDRPTISVVVKLTGGKWFMTYEYGNAKEALFAVYYKVADSSDGFGGADGHVLRDVNGEIPTGAPGCANVNGAVVVRSANEKALYVNTKPDASGVWNVVQIDAPQGYAPSLVPLGDDKLLVVGAGSITAQANTVDASIVTIQTKRRVAKRDADEKMAARFFAA